MANRRSWLTGLCLCVVCLAAYLANWRLFPAAGDVMSTRLIPFAVLGWGTVTLDPFRSELTAGGHLDYWVQDRAGSLVSLYPLGAAAVALPAYVPCYAWLRARGHDSPLDLFNASPVAEKVAASAIATVSVVVLFFILCRRVSLPIAAAIALVFGLGTNMWTIGSQNLWQHGPGALCLLAGILALEWPRSNIATAAAGFFLGMAVAVRYPNAVFLAAAAMYLWVQGENRSQRMRAVLGLVLGSLPPLAALVAYNLHYYQATIGGYFPLMFAFQPRGLWKGLPGLLLSPNRGLLMFSPVALFGLWGMARSFRRWRSEPLLAIFSGAALAFTLVHAGWLKWWGGWCFGPRYLTEILPVLALTSTLVVPGLSALARGVGVLLAAVSISIQLVGAVCYPASRWDARMAPDTERHLWEYRHLEVLEDLEAWLALRARHPREELAPGARGAARTLAPAPTPPGS